ncbi:hypothetical protein LWF15_18040 [Kineosporia rhizophila]|uniref:hypothetical protein n=1 Tax=Kineosporia rhizophila TaxID=84633 RepID=UPI001E5CC212|nr:hypothetical protein [Kineosporia rhizophila]MCE0537406.1 hypothetical protein [Kineosporia rhizophila]
MSKEPERWHLAQDGHEHTVEISTTAASWVLRWTSDGTEVAAKKTSDSTVVLDGKDHGAVRLKLPSLTGPARQVTLYSAADEGAKKSKDLGAAGQAHLGVGGTDFVPEEGSRAARREAWIREHPNQYAARRTATALAGVLVPVALIWLLRQITWRPDIDLPRIDLPRIQLPRIPWPEIDLPDIPWPDIDINLPDLPNLPGWVQYVWPVLIAFFVTQAELRRRRQQDEKRRAAAEAAAREAELKAVNEKKPVLSKIAEALPGLPKADRPDPEPEKDEKTTQACRTTEATRKQPS